MKTLIHFRYHSSKGAALMIVLALVVLLTGIALAYFSRTTTDRQLAQSSYNDTSADLLARSALDITVNDLKQEIANNQPVRAGNIQPSRYGAPPINDPQAIANLIRCSSLGDPTLRTSSVRSDLASANGHNVSLARWNSHYLIPRANTTNSIDSTPVSSFIAPYWVLVIPQGPNLAPAPGAVIGRYAFAVYDEGGLIDINLGGFPTYASLSRPTRPTRRLRRTYPSEESEIMLVTCQAPDFSPDHTNETESTGTPLSLGPYHADHHPTSFRANWLTHCLSIDTTSGIISRVPTSPGTFTVSVYASNQCGEGQPLTLNLTINGFPSPDSSPWPVNLARKGTVAFADLTTLSSVPTVITPTTSVGSMSGFPSTTQINKIMGWRSYATTQQPNTATFDIPSFPPVDATEDLFARYFLGAVLPFTTPFTRVPTTVQNGRTDQGIITRQELIRLQRTIGFSQSLLQHLGTFSRETNRPAPDWPQTLATRWDMNNLALVIPDSWIMYPGGHGVGHAYGLQRRSDFFRLFGLLWVTGNWGSQGDRFHDHNYYGHWRYAHTLNPLPANPDFFQLIDYTMNQANGGVPGLNHVRNTFNVGAALIDQYDTEDLVDPTPGQSPPPGGSLQGNTITIIDYDGNPADYAYGIEGMSYDDPNLDQNRPPFAPYPPTANYVLLNRRFENVGEFGYANNPASITASKTLDFASSTSHDKLMLDFFTYSTASPRAGIVNLNTRNVPVLASIIRGAWVQDPGAEVRPPTPPVPPTTLVSQIDALAAGQAIVQETTSNGPALNRSDVARLAGAAAAAVPNLAGSDQAKQTIARALAEIGQARAWNLMIDVIAQTGKYAPGTPDLTDPAKFTVEGEKRYWLHIALDRDSGTVLGTQLEEVVE